MLDTLRGFDESFGILMEQAETGVVDHIAKLEDVCGGYAGQRDFKTPEGTVQVSRSAADQLFGMIGLPTTVLSAFDGHPDIQRQMVAAKLGETKNPDRDVILRGKESDGKILYNAVLSEQYLPLGNAQLLIGLQEVLPGDAKIHQARIYNRQMWLRIVAPEWYHDLGPGGNAYTGLIVKNDELGRSSLSIRVGVAVVNCWNYTLAEQPIFEHAHRWIAPLEVAKALGDGVNRLDDVANEISTKLVQWQDVEVGDPKLMLKAMFGEMNMPNYAAKAANEYWEGQGAVPTLFQVIQAVTYGAQKVTAGRRKMWDNRERFEHQVLTMSTHFSETGELKICECPKCHRPLEVYEEVDVQDYELK